MGSFVGFSRNGTLTVDYPDSDQNWEGYLLNDRPDSAALYQFFDSEVDWGIGFLQHGRNITWSRTDFGSSGPDEPILQIFDQFNQALSYPWKKYGSLIKVDSGGSVRVGYGPLSNDSYPYSSWGGNFVVDPERCPALEDILNAFMDASFRAITATGRKDGNQPHEYVCDQPGIFNQAGKDMLCYSFVKDEKY
jgi:hypothetical protein